MHALERTMETVSQPVTSSDLRTAPMPIELEPANESTLDPTQTIPLEPYWMDLCDGATD